MAGACNRFARSPQVQGRIQVGPERMVSAGPWERGRPARRFCIGQSDTSSRLPGISFRGALARFALVRSGNSWRSCGYLQMRRLRPAKSCAPDPHPAAAGWRTLDALSELENQVFETDRMSRRSLRRLARSPSAAALVAQRAAPSRGVVIALFRRANSRGSRDSIRSPSLRRIRGRGIASALMAAAEKVARSRKCRFLRLEFTREITVPSRCTRQGRVS